MTDAATLPAKTQSPTAFALGDAEPVLNRRELMEGLDCWEIQGQGGRYYQPPLPMDVLSKAGNATSHHSSAFRVKVNQLMRDFIPHPMLDRTTFEGIVLDHLVLANFYVERVDNRLGRPMKLKRSMARYTRRGVEDDRFAFLSGWNKEHWFKPGSVFQGIQPWLDQEIYGVPEYLSALQSAFLNEGATLFRRRYYINGAHAGFIMYVGEGGLTEGDADALRQAMKNTKGVGNFRSMFVHLPNGKKDSIQLLHPGEAAAKDEFIGVKNTTRDDILAAHRVPPQLLGVVPANAGGFGDVEKADAVFYRNEIQPLQQRFLAINDWLGVEVVRFRERDLKVSAQTTT
ncbi:phage portal protein [Brevundimonas terrae]|uniref:Phage portal protein n=1 Tax=Brevundimonas terrae TaxID=363631 RepID=A0ABN0YGM0_9CAUL|nr:phage portal protein [Brevundimonas terrae]NIJ26936.1 PBSX family phage portal protein [Brevundimonas terrae]